jgi:hypothetical protein
MMFAQFGPKLCLCELCTLPRLRLALAHLYFCCQISLDSFAGWGTLRCSSTPALFTNLCMLPGQDNNTKSKRININWDKGKLNARDNISRTCCVICCSRRAQENKKPQGKPKRTNKKTICSSDGPGRPLGAQRTTATAASKSCSRYCNCTI